METQFSDVVHKLLSTSLMFITKHLCHTLQWRNLQVAPNEVFYLKVSTSKVVCKEDYVEEKYRKKEPI